MSSKALTAWREKNGLKDVPTLSLEQYTSLVEGMLDTLTEKEKEQMIDCLRFLETRFPAGMQDVYTFRVYRITLEYMGILSLRPSFNKVCGGYI